MAGDKDTTPNISFTLFMVSMASCLFNDISTLPFTFWTFKYLFLCSLYFRFLTKAFSKSTLFFFLIEI